MDNIVISNNNNVKSLGPSIFYPKIITRNHLSAEHNRNTMNVNNNTDLGCEEQVSIIENLFADSDLSWKPAKEHTLEDSPCYHIIERNEFKSTGTTYYQCKIHQDKWSIDLLAIEHHYKYEEPGTHKSEMLRLLHSYIITINPTAEHGLI